MSILAIGGINVISKPISFPMIGGVLFKTMYILIMYQSLLHKCLSSRFISIQDYGRQNLAFLAKIFFCWETHGHNKSQKFGVNIDVNQKNIMHRCKQKMNVHVRYCSMLAQNGEH